MKVLKLFALLWHSVKGQRQPLFVAQAVDSDGVGLTDFSTVLPYDCVQEGIRESQPPQLLDKKVFPSNYEPVFEKQLKSHFSFFHKAILKERHHKYLIPFFIFFYAA